MTERYDTIGRSYVATRGEDPRIAAAIHAALGDARTVLNVGAGTGAYEPRDRDVTAVEPSAVMRAQRPPGAAPCLDARAEALTCLAWRLVTGLRPRADGAFDAAMAILSDHHWDDRVKGLRELRRVGRRAVVFQWDPAFRDAFWLVRDFLSSFAEELDTSFAAAKSALGATREIAVPIPHDCRDGFLMAYWRRPEAYLDPVVRANISVFALLPPAAVEAMVAALRADLESGAWAERHTDLLEREQLDLGYRILVAE